MTIDQENAPIFLGIGNPLLDLSITVKDDDLHKKYGLKTDDAILAEDKHKNLYNELINNASVQYIAGGATLNSTKMIQWLSKRPETAAFFGSIGNDDAGKKLKQTCDSLQLKTMFLYSKEHETGKCAVLVKGLERSLTTHLGAACDYKNENMTKEMWDLAANVSVYYIAGYFLTSSTETIMNIAAIAGRSEEKLFAFNLSAPFLSQFFTAQMDQVLPYVDILFGNSEEASAFAKAHNIDDSSEKVCEYFCSMKRPDGCAAKQRIAIITNGGKDIKYQVGKEKGTFSVAPIDQSKIVDSNGAGDGFVAGFLYQYQITKSIHESLEMATKAARYILFKSGFSLGDRNEF